jgi:hypothetical protein
MARSKGTANYAGNFEPNKAAPLDARGKCGTYADLILDATWRANDGNLYAYDGMVTTVASDPNTSLNGVYWLKQLPFSDVANWEKIGTGGGGTSFNDSVFSIFDDTDNSKIAKFQLDALPTAETRVYNLPIADGTLARLEDLSVGASTHTALGGKNEQAGFQHVDTLTEATTIEPLDRLALRQESSGNVVLVDPSLVGGASDTSELPLDTPLLGATNQDEYNVANEADKATLATTFDELIGIKLDRYAGYMSSIYAQTGAMAIAIASGSVIGGWHVLPIINNGAAITIIGAVQDPKSDTANIVVGSLDRYVFWKDSIGTYYSITNM